MKFIKNLWVGIFILTGLNACFKDKLDQPVQGLYTQSEISNRKGVEELLIGAYSLLDGSSGNAPFPEWVSAASNWIYGSICGGEAYKGAKNGDQEEIIYLETFTAVPGNDYLDGKWTAVYEGIQRANSVLRTMRNAKDMTTDDTVEVRSEALFLRAFYHFEAKKMWNNIPFVDESVNYDNGNYHIANNSTWLPIENDLIYAENNLPSIQNSVGRVNKYAAEALLSKVYLFEHKYDLAQPLLQDLILNGVTSNGLKYALLPLYSDNFNAATKNSTESVFACQNSVNDISGGANGNVGDLLNFPNGGESGCCGFFQPSQYLVNHFKTDSVTGLPDLNNYNVVDVYNDEGIQSAEAFTPYAGSLDPRLDWTVGRRGIPYYDWGINPGFDWIRDQAFSGPYSPKKNVFLKSQEGEYVQSGYPLLTAINVNLIRFADILLWAAETEIMLPGGDLEKARGYVNQVRSRAMNPDGYVHTYIDDNDPTKGFTNIPAANYKIDIYKATWTDRDFALKAVQYERMLELGMEGHRFFDLVRWGIANTELNSYFKKEMTLRSFLNIAYFTQNKNEYFPIPQNELDLSAGSDGVQKMIQNPGY